MLTEDALIVVDSMLKKVFHEDLPLPYSINFQQAEIEFQWMLEDDLDGSRAVFNAFKQYGWETHAVSRVADGPVLVCKFGNKEVTLWSHKDAVRTTLEATS